jgi:hypothetical protein
VKIEIDIAEDFPLMKRLMWMRANLLTSYQYRYEDSVEPSLEEMLKLMVEWAAGDFEWLREKMRDEKKELLSAKRDGAAIYGKAAV